MRQPQFQAAGLKTHPHRLAPAPDILAAVPVGLNSLTAMAGRSILGTGDVAREELLALIRLAAMIQAGTFVPARQLSGVAVLTAFFEPSTRTRLSFESAILRLGGLLLTVGMTDSLSVAKGESLADTGAMFNNYADVVVVRHSSPNALHELARGGFEKPLINGGNGQDEHPTQAMADWYALSKWRPGLVDSRLSPRPEKIDIGVLGSPIQMRSVRSFLRFGISFFAHAISSVTIVSRDEEVMDGPLRSEFLAAGVPFRHQHEFDGDASSFDVLYQNAICKTSKGLERIEGYPRLTPGTVFKPGSVIMHPLARLEELSTGLDDTSHNLYFEQAAGAVFIRQALLLAIAGRLPPDLVETRPTAMFPAAPTRSTRGER